MTHPTQDKQGRNFDVPYDPDGWRITTEFYACVGTIAGALVSLWIILS